jgi:CubicO group peptidase (beta-lactamase class C family)
LLYGNPAQGVCDTLCCGKRGVTRDRVEVKPDLIYDLASLTKIISTTTLFMMTLDKGLIDLDSPLASLGWEIKGSLKKATIRRLLAHQSGLPAWRPYHQDDSLSQDDDGLLEDDSLLEEDGLLEDDSLLEEESLLVNNALKTAILRETLECDPGQRTIYSDLNFMLLGMILVERWEKRLESLFKTLISQPLGLLSCGFNPSGRNIAPTEDGFRIGGPLDYRGAPIKGPVPLGTVHDDNARAQNGVSGHAGLFSSAQDVWKVVRLWAEAFDDSKRSLVSKGAMDEFLCACRPKSGAARALGFDLGQGTLQGARGHTGYTGPSLWWNPQKDRAFVFLCNRVHPTARASKMENFRKELADRLWG